MKFIFALLTVFATSSYAGHESGNGTGLAEGYVSYAHLNMRAILSEVMVSSRSLDIGLLLRIQDALPKEYANSNQLVFTSDSEKGKGFFTIEGLPRIAKTGKNVGDAIYINNDLLYSSGKSNVDLGRAVAILVHELGHHHGIQDHQFLDNLGNSVATVMSESSTTAKARLPISKSRNTWSAQLLQGKDPQLIVAMDRITRNIPWDPGFFNWCGTGSTVAEVFVANLHWSAQTKIVDEYNYKVTLRAHVTLYCAFPSKTKISIAEREIAIHLNNNLGLATDKEWPSAFEVLDCENNPKRCW